ncbi:MAG: hypothetical protein J1E39_05465 [Eubacterium sp.]|nr:hypothetical protein [Eubacterium sp.]
MSIYLYELKKLCGIRIIFIFLCFMAVKLATTYFYYPPEYEFSKDFYREYTDTLFGEHTAEKEQYILGEQARLEDILSRKEETESAYIRDEITLEEYIDFNTEYIRAENQLSAFNKIYEKYEYFLTVEDKGPQYFYDLDVIEYLGEYGADVLLLLFLIIFGLRFWDYDRLCGMSLSVISTPLGRIKRDNIKCAALITMTVISSLLSFIPDIISFCMRCGGEMLNMPLCSMAEFGCCGYQLSVLGYMLLVLLVRTVWAVSMCVLLCLIYKLIINMYAGVALSAAVILLPVMAGYGLPPELRTVLIGSQLTGFSVLETSIPCSMLTAVIITAAMYGIIILAAKKKRI